MDTAVLYTTKVPMVGVLMQYGSKGMAAQFPAAENNYQFAAASYCEYVGQTGAMPVLLPFDLSDEKLYAILDQLQAVVIPGGGSDLGEVTGEPTDLMKTISKIVAYSKKKLDSENKQFPIFGICMGFQGLFMAFSDPKVLTAGFNDKYQSHPVVVDPAVWPQSRFFSKLKKEVTAATFEQGHVYYWHTWGIRYESLDEPQYAHLKDELLILAHSREGAQHDGQKFVALFEHRKYPIYGSQFHPEKLQYEANASNGFLDRSATSLKFVIELIHQFVDEARAEAKTYSDIPEWIKPYFSFMNTAALTGYDGSERSYVFPRFSPPNK